MTLPRRVQGGGLSESIGVGGPESGEFTCAVCRTTAPMMRVSLLFVGCKLLKV